MDSREKFEKKFPVPDGVSWRNYGDYIYNKGWRHGHICEGYQAKYEAWKAAWQHQQAKIDAMRAMMKKHEWGNLVYEHGCCGEACFVCGRFKDEGHAPDCELARLIKE